MERYAKKSKGKAIRVGKRGPVLGKKEQEIISNCQDRLLRMAILKQKREKETAPGVLLEITKDLIAFNVQIIRKLRGWLPE